MVQDTLVALGIEQADATRSVALFRDHDEHNLIDTHAIYDDERQSIQTTLQAAAELTALFEADRRGDQGRSRGDKPQLRDFVPSC
jgi:glutathione-regulated potassium-efflux system protein KefB